MKKRLVRTSLGILLLAGGIGTWYYQPYRLDYGTLKHDVYRNGYFRLRLPVKGWFVVDMEESKWRAEVMRDPKKIPSTIPPRPPAYKRPSIHLVTIYDRQWTGPNEFNPSLFVFAEKCSLRPQALDADTYLSGVIAEMVTQHPETRTPEPLDHILVDRKRAARMRVEMADGGRVFRQEYYSLMARGYFLSFILTWETMEDRIRLQSLVDSVRFRL